MQSHMDGVESLTDRTCLVARPCGMDAASDLRIVPLDRMDNGAVVSFDGGKTAFYSAALLYAIRDER